MGSRFTISDYNRDWIRWNEEAVDPRGDGIFLLRAQWDAVATFDANGGKFDDQNDMASIQKRANTKINIMDKPKLAGFKFLYWEDAEDNQYQPGDEYVLAKNMLFTAKWEDLRSTVTFIDTKANTFETVKVEKGKTIASDDLTDQSMPATPTLEGYTFKEWNTDVNGNGDTFTEGTVVNQDVMVYAIYVKKADPNPDPTPTPTPTPTPNPDQNGSQTTSPTSRKSVPSTATKPAMKDESSSMTLFTVLGCVVLGAGILSKKKIKETNHK